LKLRKNAKTSSLFGTISEISAQYKASIIKGKTLIDLTGGFGIDCFYFAKKFHKVTHCEMNKNLSEIVHHNYHILGVKNITTITGNGLEILIKNDTNYDWIYIDPSRRNDAKGKVFMLADCSPNIPENISDIFHYAANIMIKTSPVLDLSIGIKELPFIKEIHIIAIKNEVKELLWILEKGYQDKIHIKTINKKKEGQEVFDFNHLEEQNTKATYNHPQSYLYEPNAAILKSGAFNLIAKRLKVDKLHQHSHLYTSKEYIDFPGRSFKIIDIYPYNKKVIKKHIGKTKGNISIRNFPEAVDQLKNTFKVKDGGENYYFFTTDMQHNKIMIYCKKP